MNYVTENKYLKEKILQLEQEKQALKELLSIAVECKESSIDPLGHLGSIRVASGMINGLQYQIRKQFVYGIGEFHCGYIKTDDKSIINNCDEVTYDCDGWIGFDTCHMWNTKESKTYEGVKNKIDEMIGSCDGK